VAARFPIPGTRNATRAILVIACAASLSRAVASLRNDCRIARPSSSPSRLNSPSTAPSLRARTHSTVVEHSRAKRGEMTTTGRVARWGLPNGEASSRMDRTDRGEAAGRALLRRGSNVLGRLLHFQRRDHRRKIAASLPA
jgi:hypothetical protein